MKIEQFQKNGCAGKEDIMKKLKDGLGDFFKKSKKFVVIFGIGIIVMAVIFAVISIFYHTGKFDYGSYWGGIIGGIISGLLTVTGVCWTISDLQSERNEQLHKRVIECATIIYYDFKFAHEELSKICAQENDKKFYNFYIDKDWITHVATLVYVDELHIKIQNQNTKVVKLEMIKFRNGDDEIGIIEKIYNIYGFMEFLSRHWDNGEEISDDMKTHCQEILNEFTDKNAYIGNDDIENLLTYNNMESYDIIMEVLQNIMNSDKQPSSINRSHPQIQK